MWDYLEGKLSRAEMVERAIIATRQLAKRQITWLRKFPEQGRFEVNGLDFDAIRHYLDHGLSVRG
jgi:tRNA A37 N6-isopentenylltransferase MiaA